MNDTLGWLKRVFGDSQTMVLIVLLVTAALSITYFAHMFAPAIAAVVIAFLLDAPVEFLKRRGVRPILALTFVFLLFLLITTATVVLIIPPLLVQVASFLQDSPDMVGQIRDALISLQTQIPDLVSEAQLQSWFDLLGTEIATLGPEVLAVSVSGITGAVTVLIYVILVPLMVFFFLRDKRAILAWIGSFLPKDRTMLQQIWRDITAKSGAYARGKIYQILIITAISLVAFHSLGLDYATLISVMTGFSVLLPFVGAAIVTVPVILVSYFQFGWSTDMGTALGLYFTIQAFDGNILNPLLFSEVVDLHPNAIILAILFFGGIWGFWGLFFAIPLASVINAVLHASRNREAITTD